VDDAIDALGDDVAIGMVGDSVLKGFLKKKNGSLYNDRVNWYAKIVSGF